MALPVYDANYSLDRSNFMPRVDPFAKVLTDYQGAMTANNTPLAQANANDLMRQKLLELSLTNASRPQMIQAELQKNQAMIDELNQRVAMQAKQANPIQYIGDMYKQAAALPDTLPNGAPNPEKQYAMQMVKNASMPQGLGFTGDAKNVYTASVMAQMAGNPGAVQSGVGIQPGAPGGQVAIPGAPQATQASALIDPLAAIQKEIADKQAARAATTKHVQLESSSYKNLPPNEQMLVIGKLKGIGATDAEVSAVQNGQMTPEQVGAAHSLTPTQVSAITPQIAQTTRSLTATQNQNASMAASQALHEYAVPKATTWGGIEFGGVPLSLYKDAITGNATPDQLADFAAGRLLMEHGDSLASAIGSSKMSPESTQNSIHSMVEQNNLPSFLKTPEVTAKIQNNLMEGITKANSAYNSSMNNIPAAGDSPVAAVASTGASMPQNVPGGTSSQMNAPSMKPQPSAADLQHMSQVYNIPVEQVMQMGKQQGLW